MFNGGRRLWILAELKRTYETRICAVLRGKGR
jgi:hypothetical protein